MCMTFFYGYHLGYGFDSQCLSECGSFSTTVGKNSTTVEEKAEGELLALDIL